MVLFKPLVSIIVPTKDRPHYLEKCVQAILKNTFEQFEVIIVDQSNNDETKKFIMDIKHNDERVQYYHSDECGASLARNLGAFKAKSDILLFTDDDCIPDNTWIYEMYSCFTDQIDLTCIMGKILKGEHDSKKGGILAYMPEKREKIDGIKNLVKKGMGLLGAGPNIGVRKEALLGVNGFDESVMNSDDWDLLLRLLSNNNTLMVLPSSIVVHQGYLSWNDLYVRYHLYVESNIISIVKLGFTYNHVCPN